MSKFVPAGTEIMDDGVLVCTVVNGFTLGANAVSSRDFKMADGSTPMPCTRMPRAVVNFLQKWSADNG